MGRLLKVALFVGGAVVVFRVGQYAIERYGRLHNVPQVDLVRRREADVALSNKYPITHMIAGTISPVVDKRLLEIEHLLT